MALFAALSYAVTNSGRGGSGIDKEQAKIDVSQMLQYGAMLRTATQRLVIFGLAPESVRINNGGVGAPCETGEDCVFAPEGGGASSIDMHNVGTDDLTSIGWHYSDVSNGVVVPGLGTGAAEILIYRSLPINENAAAFCRVFNSEVGLGSNVIGDGSTHYLAAAENKPVVCVQHFNTAYYILYTLYEN